MNSKPGVRFLRREGQTNGRTGAQRAKQIEAPVDPGEELALIRGVAGRGKGSEVDNRVNVSSQNVGRWKRPMPRAHAHIPTTHRDRDSEIYHKHMYHSR